MKNLAGLSVVNVELTSRCNKSCWMCGRRKIDKDYPELKQNYGDMDIALAYYISKQLPEGILVQLHNNGEPTLYPELGEAIDCFHKQITSFNTNGKLLLERADEIIGRLDTLTISVIENDKEGDKQYEIVKKFLEIKKNKKPFMIYRLLGDISIRPAKTPFKETKDYIDIEIDYNEERKERWYHLPGLVATRILHNPMGSFDYTKKVTIPEHGICLDLLTHLVFDRFGNCYPCVRFDPHRYNLLGNIKYLSIEKLWNHPIRKKLIKEHTEGNRRGSKLCTQCHFYGCPTSS